MRTNDRGISVPSRMNAVKRGKEWLHEYKCPACGLAVLKTSHKAMRSTKCRSCGNKKHGMYGNPLYAVWDHMTQRCFNPKDKAYKRYGGRGVKVCREWLDKNAFFDWCKSNGWNPGLEIDRIDNDGDYCPANCRFVTPAENCRNRSTTKLTLADARVIKMLCWSGLSRSQVAEIFGVSCYAIHNVMRFRTWQEAVK